VPPSEFILLAEETGLVEEIGLWVLREACCQVKLWSLEGIDLPVNVNVSGHQLQNPGFPPQVADIMSTCGVEPSRITLEITESALMKDAETSASILGKLRRLGVKLAVDDFGTGYSSLSYLQSFPVDILKIDRSFVEGIEAGSDKIALVRAVVKLGRELKLATVAEGVEVPKQAEILRELGCSRAQGFYFSHAVDPTAIAQMKGAQTWVDGLQEVCDTSGPTSTTSPGFSVGI
jgi:EAL domain-containing protein (putative c-di-GMP-specific phosphodiesterase class I)